MSQLYIGNVSKQIQMFCYRALEKTGIVTQPIPIGGQIRVTPPGGSEELSTPEIDNILSQHRIYGITPADNLDENSPFSGLIYSIGKPISVEKLRKAMQKNEEMLRAAGRKLRQEAALAVNSQIEEQVGPLRNLEMSFEEVEPRGGYAEDFEHVSEGVQVTRQAKGLQSVEGRRGRR